MQRFIIERDIAGASDLTEDQLADIATKSNATSSRSACRTAG